MNTAMTLSELMAHFQIDERYYDRVSQWLCEHANDVLHESNNGKRRNRLYDVEKFANLYPHTSCFNSIGDTSNLVVAAELLAEAINDEYDKNLTADDILKGFAKSKDRANFISSLRDITNEIYVKHQDIEKWYERIEFKYGNLTNRLRNLTVIAIVSTVISIITIITSIFV